MARQFDLDEDTYINADDNSREFDATTETYFIEEESVTPVSTNLLPLLGVG